MLVGMQNGTATLEDSLMMSYETKYTLTILSSNYAFWYLSKKAENIYPHKNLHPMFTVALFIIVTQNLETLRYFSTREWTNKL